MMMMSLSKKCLAILALVALPAAAAQKKHLGRAPASHHYVVEHRQLFFQWMQEHGKEYSDSNELLSRMEVWLNNHGKFVVTDACDAMRLEITGNTQRLL